LPVIALTGASHEAGLCETDLQVVIFVRLGSGWVEGQLVIRIRIDEAFLQESGNIVAGGESKAAALDGKHLEAQIAWDGLTGLGNTLDELLIVEDARGVACTKGVDAVEGDAGPPKLIGETDDTLENLLLLLRVELDVGTREKGPPRRYPKEDLASRTRSFACYQVTQSLERELQPFRRAIEAGGTANVTEPSGVLIQRGTESVAVGRETLLHLNACVCKDGKCGGVCEATSIGMEKILDLAALVSDVRECVIDRIDEQNDLDGSLATTEGLERGNGLWGFVVEESKVLLLETGYRRP
jgi:hypothetical protein